MEKMFFEKSLAVLGNPESVNEEMFSQLSAEDTEFLMSKAEEGSLAAFINSSFAV